VRARSRAPENENAFGHLGQRRFRYRDYHSGERPLTAELGGTVLMLRGALETRRGCARRALRPLTDTEWTFGKLTLGTRLCADGGGARGEGAGVTGQENERRHRRELVEEPEYSRTTRRTGSREAIHFKPPDREMAFIGIFRERLRGILWKNRPPRNGHPRVRGFAGARPHRSPAADL
jgi:hypothetical protein